MRTQAVTGMAVCGCVALVSGLFWSGASVLCAPAEPQQSSAIAARRSRSNVGTVLPSSRVYVWVGKTGFGHEHGVEGRIKSGRIRLNAARDAGQIVFDMRSFDADTTAARRYVGLEGTTDGATRSQVTRNMLGADVLNVQRFPTATFQVDSALPTGKTVKGHPQYVLSGKFTLHGVTRPLRVTAEAIDVRESTTRLRGVFGIRQTDYGITPYSKAFGAVGVADALKIYGELDIAGSAEASAH